MSRGVNKVIVVGRLGNGNQEEQTEWHRVVYFGRLAEICGTDKLCIFCEEGYLILDLGDIYQCEKCGARYMQIKE